MSAPSSLFAKIKMSKSACGKWLESSIKRVSDYADWGDMSPGAPANPDDPLLAFKHMTVEDFLDGLAENSRFFCCEYDDSEAAFFIADIRHCAGAFETAARVAALRGAESFKDDDEPSFIYIFPALSGGDPDALLRIRRGGSRFLRATDPSPDVLYFVNEAEEFIEAMAEEDDG